MTHTDTHTLHIHARTHTHIITHTTTQHIQYTSVSHQSLMNALLENILFVIANFSDIEATD